MVFAADNRCVARLFPLKSASFFNNLGQLFVSAQETALKPVNIGICGIGTVGGGTVDVLCRNAVEIAARSGRDVKILQLGSRRPPKCDIGDAIVSSDIFDVAVNPDIDILVELIGGTTTARDLVMKAIANGKHVVTANKALIAEYGNEIFAAAAKHGVTVAFEAAVAGGIPIIKALREGLSGNRIEWLAGIINGTGNFILTEMDDRERGFAEVLAEAQELGYAEADPTFDVEGIDAAHKLVILTALAFGVPLQFDKVYTEGITKIELRDIKFARELGYRIKHLGIARRHGDRLEMRVHPTLIPQERLIANVNGVMNAVLVQGDAVGPTLYCGAGAGGEATASAVVADIIDLVRTLDATPEQRVPPLAHFGEPDAGREFIGIAEVVCAHYLRMTVLDETGVLTKISQILANAGISIEAVIQKEARRGEKTVPLVLITNEVADRTITDAVVQIEATAMVEGSVMRIRVEELAG